MSLSIIGPFQMGQNEKWNFEGTYVVSSYIEKEMWKP